MAAYLSEDIIRDKARAILGLEDTETARAGVGQLTSWNKLGFKNIKGAPDGWYLPNTYTFPAIIAEFKSSNVALGKAQIEELLKNVNITKTKYSKVIGILWNGEDILVYKDGTLLENENELRNKEYYLGLYAENHIDQQQIFNITKRINDSLHFNFGIKNLYHRMIFTACALVAKRYGAPLVHGMNYSIFHQSILSTLAKSYEDERNKNSKLDLLGEVYAQIKMNITNNQEAIDDFIDYITAISDNLNSDFWRGEDVMAIFFNEFNRYKGKSESGQVFTPDHITSLIYRILQVNQDDVILDAACGSGAFLVKAMCNMIQEAGGIRTNKAIQIKTEQLYGIEIDREVYALACANMLIHKDGKTNLAQMDSRSEEAAKWIKSKHITKVLMNPPFENKYGCLDIVANVLNNVQKDVICAFIMPDNKLEKNESKARKILKKHQLEKIIKLPEEIFNAGITTSVFIFRAQVPQNNKQIFACNIEYDGLETVKNQGRQDIKQRWQDIENYWVDVIYKQAGDKTIQWLDSNLHLSYQTPKQPFTISEADFKRTVLNYVLFQNEIDEQQFKEQLVQHCLYGYPLKEEYKQLYNTPHNNTTNNIDIANWKQFKLIDLFDKVKTKKLPYKVQDAEKTPHDEFILPALTAGVVNQGLACYVPAKGATILKNVISVSANGANAGAMFFQAKEFTVLQDAYAIELRSELKHCLKRNEALFLISVMYRAVKIHHDWKNKAGWNMIQNETILLPTTTDLNGNITPDWQFMEDYILSLEYAKHLK